jgi:hypothetical protein
MPVVVRWTGDTVTSISLSIIDPSQRGADLRPAFPAALGGRFFRIEPFKFDGFS